MTLRPDTYRSLEDLPSRYDRDAAARPDDRKGRTLRRAGTVMLAAAVVVILLGLWWVWSLASAPVSLPQAASPRTQADAAELVEVLDRGRRHIDRAEWDKAITLLAPAVRTWPEHQELRVAHARTLVGRRDLALAYESAVAALAIGPRTADLEFFAGTIAASIDRHDRALEHFSAAQTADQSNPTYPLYLAQAQRAMGELNAAKASLLRVVNMAPDNALGWGSLAEIELAQNLVDSALRHAGRARELEPERPEWRLIEARALKRAGEPEQALLVIAPLPAEHRLSTAFLRVAAECYGLLRRPEDAAKLYASALKHDPTDGGLALETAVWFDRAGDEASALEYARRAVDLGSQDAEALAARLARGDG